MASAGALAGLIGVALGFRVADPVAGFAITALIIHIGIHATRDVASRLMDVNDEEVTDAVRAAAMGCPECKAFKTSGLGGWDGSWRFAWSSASPRA